MQENKSALESSQKFHLKSTNANKSMIDNNLNSAIKKSNVKNFMKKGMSVMNQNSAIEDNADQGLEDHLLQLKKSCSELSREVKTKEQEANKYKDQASFTSGKANKIKQQRQKLEERIAELERNLDKVNNKRQSALHSSKTYEHILKRMKKDDIHKQLQKNQLQRQLRNLQKSFNFTEAKNYSASQFQKLSCLGLRDAYTQMQQQKDLRKNHLSSVNKQASKKMQKQNKLNQRQKQTEQIQELAACDIQDADLMRLKKFLTVQIFLRELLKSKMSKLKQYYEPCEWAFFQIKSNTSVRDANSLKSQFFGFENNYNEKTVWVKHLQTEILDAQEKNKALKKQLNDLKMAEMEAIEKIEANGKSLEHQNLRQLNQKSLMFEAIWEKIKAWIKVQAKKLEKINRHQQPEKVMLQILNLLRISETPNPPTQEKQQSAAVENQNHVQAAPSQQKLSDEKKVQEIKS